MVNHIADFASIPSHAARCASLEKGERHPIAPNTAQDNSLGDYFNPVWDGPGACGLKKLPPLPNLNTEGDE